MKTFLKCGGIQPYNSVSENVLNIDLPFPALFIFIYIATSIYQIFFWIQWHRTVITEFERKKNYNKFKIILICIPSLIQNQIT